MTWDEYIEKENRGIDEIRAFVNDFENCGVHDACELCKCYERLNDMPCTICELLLAYRNDLSDKITDLIDKM